MSSERTFIDKMNRYCSLTFYFNINIIYASLLNSQNSPKRIF